MPWRRCLGYAAATCAGHSTAISTGCMRTRDVRDVASPRRTVGAERVVSNFVSEKAFRGALIVVKIAL
jgi:hypothetical protein